VLLGVPKSRPTTHKDNYFFYRKLSGSITANPASLQKAGRVKLQNINIFTRKKRKNFGKKVCEYYLCLL